jgi:hypothetical protein
MLATRFRAPVGHKLTRPPGDHQKPWLSLRHVQHAGQPGTRAMGPYPPRQTEASVEKLPALVSRWCRNPAHFCRAPDRDGKPVVQAPLPARDMPRGGRHPDEAVALHDGRLCKLRRSFLGAAPRLSSQSTDFHARSGSRRYMESCAEEGQQADVPHEKIAVIRLKMWLKAALSRRETIYGLRSSSQYSSIAVVIIALKPMPVLLCMSRPRGQFSSTSGRTSHF